MDIRIPYYKNMELGRAYNIAMETVKDWILFVDHDLMLSLNPYYYSICKNAINELGHQAGWITCKTNRIACSMQLDTEAPKNDDILSHMKYAKRLWSKHGDKYTCCTQNTKSTPFSGFFMLTHKRAWEEVGGFQDGFLGVDNDYYRKLINNGYDTYVLNGVYVYHLYKNKKLWDGY